MFFRARKIKLLLPAEKYQKGVSYTGQDFRLPEADRSPGEFFLQLIQDILPKPPRLVVGAAHPAGAGEQVTQEFEAVQPRCKEVAPHDAGGVRVSVLAGQLAQLDQHTGLLLQLEQQQLQSR